MNEEKKVVKVTDGSQKWKFVVYGLVGLPVLYGMYKIVALLIEIRDLLVQILAK
jgi:hypothetical protein